MSQKSLSFKNEFRKKNFGFKLFFDESKMAFVSSKIAPIRPSMVLVYRLIVSTYLLFMIVLSMSWRGSLLKWLTYMTSINYIVVFVYFVSALLASCSALFRNKVFVIKKGNNSVEFSLVNKKASKKNGAKNRDEDLNGVTVDSIISGIEENYTKRMSVVSVQVNQTTQRAQSNQCENNLPTIYKVHWFFSALTLNMSLIVTLVYWLLLFRTDRLPTPLAWFLNIDRHLIMLVWVIIDHVITKIPIRVLHFVYPSTLFLLYNIFNIVYTKLTKIIIYPIVNIDKEPVMTVGLVLAASFLCVPIVQVFLYWIIYRLREKLL
ncbi:uncharacterized protein LOC100206519 [Hydra vulgaris]|uniref:uncharacterized protein LOC100206519 n=1 Tax=Hydra vulgaris TaxID=6087 RepID=UPI000192486A|nr:uncharacterized protein LOC100206519 [Hydra vulgaris]